jgi:hypothetical protein
VPMAAEGLCLLQALEGGTSAFVCARRHHLLHEGLFMTSLPTVTTGVDTKWRVVVGIAPDGVRAVRVVANHTAQSASVRENAFVLRDTKHLQPESGADAAGVDRTQTVDQPFDLATKFANRCGSCYPPWLAMAWIRVALLLTARASRPHSNRSNFLSNLASM